MEVRTLRWIVVPCLLALGAGGCHSRVAGEPPGPQPSSGRRGTYETYRLAESRDLKLYIYGVRPGDGGYPFVLLILQNVGSEAVLVPYGPGSVTVRCDRFVQPGPAGVDRVHREVLGPGEILALSPPAGGWGESSGPAAPPDLIVPERLPPGQYEISATYQIPQPPGGLVTSDRRKYRAP